MFFLTILHKATWMLQKVLNVWITAQVQRCRRNLCNPDVHVLWRKRKLCCWSQKCQANDSRTSFNCRIHVYLIQIYVDLDQKLKRTTWNEILLNTVFLIYVSRQTTNLFPFYEAKNWIDSKRLDEIDTYLLRELIYSVLIFDDIWSCPKRLNGVVWFAMSWNWWR